MKALLAFGTLAALLSGGSLAYWASTRPAALAPPPGVVYIPEPVVEFGRVGLNKTISGAFTVVNGSSEVVTIGGVAKSCACTTAECSADVLAPGERAEVRFQVRTGDRRGARAETVALQFYRASGQQGDAVAAKVTFMPTGVFDVDTPQVTLTAAEPKAEIKVLSESAAEGQRVLKVESRNPCVKVDASRLPIVALELDPKVPGESIVNTECLIHTSVLGEEVIAVPVRVRR